MGWKRTIYNSKFLKAFLIRTAFLLPSNRRQSGCFGQDSSGHMQVQVINSANQTMCCISVAARTCVWQPSEALVRSVPCRRFQVPASGHGHVRAATEIQQNLTVILPPPAHLHDYTLTSFPRNAILIATFDPIPTDLSDIRPVIDYAVTARCPAGG